jgi:hypothetical protein
MRELWIIDRHTGQLGNKLMFLAAAYAWCLEEQARLRLPAFHKYAGLFPALAAAELGPPEIAAPAGANAPRDRRLVLCLRAAARLRLLPGVLRKPSGLAAIALPPTCEAFPPPRLRARRRLFMTAWRFFNPLGLRRHRAAILAATRPQADVERNADRFIGALDPARLWIGIHVRAGDYATFRGGKHFHPVARYAAEMRAAADRFRARRPAFVLFSDAPRSAAEFPGFDVILSAGSAIEDLARMSRLKLVIGPMSTFSAWAMYRAGGVAFHFGPPASEDGLDWVYSGYPVARDLDSVAEALARVERGELFEPPIDLSPQALRPVRVGR